MSQKRAYWEYRADYHQFIVSPEWEALTGYAAADLFPQNMSKKISIESQLDNLIDKMLTVAVPEDRAELKLKASEFLLSGAVDKKFQHAYRFRRKDDNIIAISSEASSFWDTDGNLIGLFAVSTNVTGLILPTQAAAAIAANSSQIERIESAVTGAKRLAVMASGVWPVVLALLVAFNDALDGGKQQLLRTWRILTSNVESNKNLESSVFVPDALDEAATDKILREFKTWAYLGTVTLAAYEPQTFPYAEPELYKNLLQSSTDADMIASPTNSTPYKTTASPVSAQKTKAHFVGQSFDNHYNNMISYSVPIKIAVSADSVQILYVQIVAESSKEEAEIANAVNNLAGKVTAILSQK